MEVKFVVPPRGCSRGVLSLIHGDTVRYTGNDVLTHGVFVVKPLKTGNEEK